MIIKLCEICQKKILSPFGPTKSPVLVLWDKLTLEEYEKGWFHSETSGILRNELAKYGLDIWNYRNTSLWLHEPEPKNKPDKLAQIQKAIAECQDRKLILLLGSDCTKLFLKYSATDVSGILMKSELLTAPVIGTLSPSAVLGNSYGEFQLGIQKFSWYVKEYINE